MLCFLMARHLATFPWFIWAVVCVYLQGAYLETVRVSTQLIQIDIQERDLAAWRYAPCLLPGISLDDDLSKSWSKRSHRWFIWFQSYPWFQVPVCLIPYLISLAKSQFVNTNWKHARVSVHVNPPLHLWMYQVLQANKSDTGKMPGKFCLYNWKIWACTWKEKGCCVKAGLE